jgi:alpha-tubulin suppressor-like RCC1 family protein
LVLGKNKNYNLGNSVSRDNVDSIEYFRKNNILISKADVNFYHSLFLTDQGLLFACGHGKGGRLGIGTETTTVEPQKVIIKFVHKNEKIVDISAGKYHSLIVTDRDIVYSSGLNQYLQLGLKNQPEKTLQFKEISNYEQFRFVLHYR